MAKPPGHINPGFRKKKPSEKVAGKALLEALLQGDIKALSQAITLVESTKMSDRKAASELLQALPVSDNSLRIGVTGIPGAGKSTFIEAVGKHFLQKGKKIAVLAIDPSSQMSGGSILGDKTRMEALSRLPDVYIRPSPSGGALGGVARSTRETITLCEAAGFEILFIETVGVGQSEITVHSMTDIFLLLAVAGTGDELQGIKRGIMEMADLVVVNKAEAENQSRAAQAKKQLENAIHLYPPNRYGFSPEVFKCSAVTGEGIEEVAKTLLFLKEKFTDSDAFSLRRKEQNHYWFVETVRRKQEEWFTQQPQWTTAFQEAESAVKSGEINPFEAAEQLFRKI